MSTTRLPSPGRLERRTCCWPVGLAARPSRERRSLAIASWNGIQACCGRRSGRHTPGGRCAEPTSAHLRVLVQVFPSTQRADLIETLLQPGTEDTAPRMFVPMARDQSGRSDELGGLRGKPGQPSDRPKHPCLRAHRLFYRPPACTSNRRNVTRDTDATLCLGRAHQDPDNESEGML